MFRRYFFPVLACAALIFSTGVFVFAQTGQLRGHVVVKQADGTTIPGSDAAIDVFRTDLPGKYTTKTDKKGDFVFAGLPYVGTYIIAVSRAASQPYWMPNVKAGRDIDYAIDLEPGDGRHLTLDEIKTLMAKTPGSAPSRAKETSEDKAKRAELERKNAEIAANNEKSVKSNEIVARTYKAGNDAFLAKNYDEAIKQYAEGLAADPEQPALLVNQARAYTARGVDRYNAAITAANDAAKSSGLESAKGDFRSAATAASKAVEMLKAQPAPTDPAALTRFNNNKLAALAVNAEAMRLFVTKVDPSQADAGVTAYQEYIAAEGDPVKKSKAEHDLAQMLFDANVFDRALSQYQKILEANPDDLDALLRAGQALFNIGAINTDKTKYQEAANYLARFVEKAPDTNPLKADAKAILDTLKDQANVKPEKTTTPARRTRRP